MNGNTYIIKYDFYGKTALKVDTNALECYTDNQIIGKYSGSRLLSVPDKSIDPRLLLAARKALLSKGYELASLSKFAGLLG